jgi:putative transposase
VAGTAGLLPHWNAVHRCQVRRWSNDGTWEKIVERLRELVRAAEDRDLEPSVGALDARSVRGASTVTSETRGYDDRKKISGRKCSGIVDTLGLVVAVVVVVAASTSDNVGGAAVFGDAAPKSKPLKHLFCDGRLENSFAETLEAHHVVAEVVSKIHPGRFEVLPKRWIIERTWSRSMNNRRLQIDHERLPVVTDGFVWAAHARLLLRRLTQVTEGQRAA